MIPRFHLALVLAGFGLVLAAPPARAAAPGFPHDVPAFALEKIQPALREQLVADATSASTLVPVIVMLPEQADLASLDAQFYAAGIGKAGRAPIVMDELRSVAARTQASVSAALDVWRAEGKVDRERMFWIVNGFALRATPDVIVALAERDDVATVSFDGPLELEDYVDEGPATQSPGGAEIGLTAVNARALWDLGFTGQGVIMMNIDTGVDATHAALARSYYGNSPGPGALASWFDPVGEECSTPCDYGEHGTHTMGTMVGLDPATADTIGVAFGAKWIAAATIDINATPHTSYSVAAFEWALDPGVGNRPPADVISCSWRDPWLSFADECGPNGTYWAAIDAFEAAGGAVVFSAGNSGPGTGTITAPKNRISSPVNIWATGNVNANQAGYPISSSSSRGPSDCDGTTIKPEAVAPGSSVRSSVPGGYSFFSGTSMASPHVAGVVALLMEAFPWATGTEIKTALLATATDLGAAGEDNVYGHGLINAGAAFEFLGGASDIRDELDVSRGRGVSLAQNAPNPFNPSTSIRYELPSRASVNLRVYNAHGQVVATVVDGVAQDAGSHTARWNGRTASGTEAASGMYFFRLEARPDGDAAAAPTVRVRQAVLLR
ncbi:MAG: S8 family serine peptidase [Gemmatimonadetes bacterium]|nr:S8 family serine peptidase [Gemmatimonadota bacterium]